VSADKPPEIPSAPWVAKLPEEDRAIFDRIVAPARPKLKRGQWVNEGFRLICLGETDTGKTSLMRGVLYYTLAERLANFALIHDTKGVLPEYPRSLMFPTVDHFRTRGFIDGDIPVASFRGAPRFDIECPAESVGALSKEMAQKGREVTTGTPPFEVVEWSTNPHLLVVEELGEAASDGRKHIKAPSVTWGIERGRTLGESVMGTTQSPRKLPLDFYGQATAIVIFRVTGADATYLENAEFDPDMIARIRGEKNQGLPNHDFALYVKGEGWDGKIHCLSHKTALMFEG
jgi:hypothetical protein